MEREFVKTPEGQIHYRTEGSGKPVVLFHQTPRSSDEFLDIIPLLAKNNLRAIAVDTIGFGDSYKPKGKFSIEGSARSFISFFDALGLERASLVGHHTGAVIAFEIAASYPKRVSKLVLSNCPYIDKEKQEEMKSRRELDKVELNDSGNQILDLWNSRKDFYPKNRPDLLTRFVIDALKAERFSAEGHKAVREYNMEGKFQKIKCPTLLICGTRDPFVYPDLKRLAKSIPNSKVKEIKGGTVAMIDQMPDKVAKVLVNFL